jgi:hypothetical protein
MSNSQRPDSTFGEREVVKTTQTEVWDHVSFDESLSVLVHSLWLEPWPPGCFPEPDAHDSLDTLYTSKKATNTQNFNWCMNHNLSQSNSSECLLFNSWQSWPWLKCQWSKWYT